MAKIAIIGGTGLSRLKNIKVSRQQIIQTPYGPPSSALVYGNIEDTEIIFLARHGAEHTIAPHRVNYRANIWALKDQGVEYVIAVAAVGGISDNLPPATIVIPGQIIDYTYGRANTYFDDNLTAVTHIDFTNPYHELLRNKIIEAAESMAMQVVDNGVYGATQGPRLETAQEIKRMERDGCTLVGMTGMPEAALARELGLKYATCGIVANWAAGKAKGTIEMSAIEKSLKTGMEKVKKLLEQVLLLF